MTNTHHCWCTLDRQQAHIMWTHTRKQPHTATCASGRGGRLRSAPAHHKSINHPQINQQRATSPASHRQPISSAQQTLQPPPPRATLTPHAPPLCVALRQPYQPRDVLSTAAPGTPCRWKPRAASPHTCRGKACACMPAISSAQQSLQFNHPPVRATSTPARQPRVKPCASGMCWRDVPSAAASGTPAVGTS